MEIDKVFSSDVDGVADNLFSAVKNSVSEIKAMQQRKAAENVQLVIQALKKIESDLQDKFDGVTTVIEKRVAAIKDGRDGLDGRNGRDGKDGRPGRDGAPGARGPAGMPGTNGRDGEDGVSVTDARIDFDGSLIISLSSGREINVGEVVAPDLAEKIKVITNGGGTSQSVLDSLASLQAQITALSNLGAVNYVGTWDASTNTPTIVNGTGDKGDYYVVSVAGSTNIDGQTLWGVGDWIIFNGVVWQRVDGGSTGNFTDLSASGVVTLSGGTANGLAYLNGSKVLTTGSTLTFDGSRQIRLNFGGYTDWNTGYNTILVGASTVAGALNSSISHLASNLTDDTGSGGWRYVLSGSRASVLTQSNGTLTWSATTTTGSGGTSAASFLKPIISANFAGAITLNSSSDPGSLTHYGTATISDAVTLSAGTANGVAYLNGSKVLTTGSALTFDGTNFASTGIITSTNANGLRAQYPNIAGYYAQLDSRDGNSYLSAIGSTAAIVFRATDGSNVTAEGMRLTSTGLGIGTSSPAFGAGSGLEIERAGVATLRLENSTAGNNFELYSDSLANGINLRGYNNAPMVFWTNNTERMRLDSSGNLGLGVTPSAWKSDWNALDVETGGIALAGSLAAGAVTTNAFLNSSTQWVYKSSFAASMYRQISTGAHEWHIAPSGTAGNAISFTQAMTLAASGGLSIGTTSDAGTKNILLDAGGKLAGNAPSGGTSSTIELYNASTGNMNLTTGFSSAAITFATNSTERARITSGGDFGLGVTSPGAKLDVYSSSTTAGTPIAFFGKALNSNATSNVLVQFLINFGGTGSGQINANGASAAAFGTYSDARLKENIVSLPPQLANICALRPVEFDYKDGSGHQIGFVAQEMQTVYPDVVGSGNDEMLTVTGWSKTEARLVKAIQELKAEVDSLKAQLKGA